MGLVVAVTGSGIHAEETGSLSADEEGIIYTVEAGSEMMEWNDTWQRESKMGWISFLEEKNKTKARYIFHIA